MHLEEEDIPFFLTRWYETHFRNCKEEESFHDFIKNFDFGIIRYGYTAKTQEFISDKRFQKNLYMPDIEFRADVRASQSQMLKKFVWILVKMLFLKQKN